MSHLPTVLLSTFLAGATVASGVDLASARTTLTTVRTELDAEQPKFRTSIDTLNANRISALGAAWAFPALTQIKDGTSNTLRSAPESPAKAAVAAKLAELSRAIDAFATTNRDGAARWSAAFSSLQSVSAAVPPLHSRLGELAPRLGSSASVSGDIETVTLDLQRKLQSLDSSAATALSTHQAQSAAWQPVFARGQELGQLIKQSAEFGSTPGLSGNDMLQSMADMNTAFLQLQEAVQLESRRFQTLSNASRAKHDLVLVTVSKLGT